MLFNNLALALLGMAAVAAALPTPVNPADGALLRRNGQVGNELVERSGLELNGSGNTVSAVNGSQTRRDGADIDVVNTHGQAGNNFTTRSDGASVSVENTQGQALNNLGTRDSGLSVGIENTTVELANGLTTRDNNGVEINASNNKVEALNNDVVTPKDAKYGA